MHRRFAMLVLIALSIPPTVLAGDHAIAGDKIRITDPGSPVRRRFFFRSIRENEILAATLDDPRVFGATLEVRRIQRR